VIKKLNLGCGIKQEKGFINIDIKDFGQELTLDLTNSKLPYKNNSITEIKATHFFEHLNQDQIIKLLNECHRVIKKGCRLFIVVPSYKHEGAYILQHKMLFSTATFSDFSKYDRENIYGIKRWTIYNMVEKPDNTIHVYLEAVK